MPFDRWLSHTALSVMLQANEGWLWPVGLTIHFMGLSLLVGAIGFVDFRMLGFMKRVPLNAAMDFLPWAVVGFVANLITGAIFVITQPHQFWVNRVFWAKILFLVVAGINVAIFNWTTRAKAYALPPGVDTPPSFKVFAVVSLISWFAVLYFGRMMPYLGETLGTPL